MKKHILVAALSVLCLSAQPSRAADVVRLALPSTDDIDRAVAFAAEDRRFFAENGITTEVTLYRGAGAGQEALAAGAADMTVIVAPGAAIAVSRGVKEKVVAAGPIIGNEGWRILVLDNAPIKTPADLAGKKLGISSKGSTTDFYRIMTDADGEESYPITATSFILMPKKPKDSVKSRTAIDFFKWSLENGAADAAALDYVTLPASLVERIGRYLKEDFGS